MQLARKSSLTSQAHLPFERTFTPQYQEFLSKDDLAEGYQTWASRFDIVCSYLYSKHSARTKHPCRIFGWKQRQYPENGIRKKKLGL